MHEGQYPLADGGTASYVVGMKDCLNESRVMNSTDSNVGGWDACELRTYLNGDFKSLLPADLLQIFKQMRVVTANGNGATTVESLDYFAVPAEKEVWGNSVHANPTAEAGLFQFDWYKIAANCIKKVNGGANFWWERSPIHVHTRSFCRVDAKGTAQNGPANYAIGVSPFGCI